VIQQRAFADTRASTQQQQAALPGTRAIKQRVETPAFRVASK
jgi:hypothetical protein